MAKQNLQSSIHLSNHTHNQGSCVTHLEPKDIEIASFVCRLYNEVSANSIYFLFKIFTFNFVSNVIFFMLKFKLITLKNLYNVLKVMYIYFTLPSVPFYSDFICWTMFASLSSVLVQLQL